MTSADTKDRRLQMRLDDTTIDRLDDLRRRAEGEVPSRSEVIRRLIDAAWDASSAKLARKRG